MDTKLSGWKTVVSFICFALASILLLASVFLSADGIANWRQVEDVFQSDYQNTWEFQSQVSAALQGLVSSAAKDGSGEYKSINVTDPNLPCEVWVDGKLQYRSNPNVLLFRGQPEGYNFYLRYDGKAATAVKDGKAVDLRENYSGWWSPDVPATEQGKQVDIYLAAPASPSRYSQYSVLYDGVFKNQIMTRQAILWLSAIPAAGLILFIVYIIMNKHKKRADMALARGTGRIWAEFKLILAAAILLSILALRINYIYWPNSLFLLPILILGYLYLNDLRYNGWSKIIRQSLCGTLACLWRCEELKRPVEKRLQRRAVAIFVAMMPFALGTMAWGWNFRLGGGRFRLTSTFVLMLIGVALLLVQIRFLKRGMASARELALLTDQIEALHAGNFSATVTLPADADLRAAAESLAGLSAGMETAIAERTRSERMKVELITNVSHDLKTPLTSIVSYAELLSREEGLPDHVKDYVTILNQKAERLKTMVQEVFEVSKAASGDLPVTLETLDLCKLLRQTLADMAEPIEHSGLALREGIPAEPVPIRADGDRMYRVFQNLLQNALQYSLEGSRVYVDVTVRGDKAVACVRNTSKDELPAGLDFTGRFVRGDESRTDGGSGLGLSIAKTFTEACGGAFQAEAIADLFTATVEFPLVSSSP